MSTSFSEQQNASHALRHERRRSLRGSTLIYHSSRALRLPPEGVCIPRAHGRTFCPQRVRGLAAGDPLSLSPWDGHTLSNRRAVHLRCLLYQSFASVSSHPPRISPLGNNTQAAVFSLFTPVCAAVCTRPPIQRLFSVYGNSGGTPYSIPPPSPYTGLFTGSFRFTGSYMPEPHSLHRAFSDQHPRKRRSPGCNHAAEHMLRN